MSDVTNKPTNFEQEHPTYRIDWRFVDTTRRYEITLSGQAASNETILNMVVTRWHPIVTYSISEFDLEDQINGNIDALYHALFYAYIVSENEPSVRE